MDSKRLGMATMAMAGLLVPWYSMISQMGTGDVQHAK